MYVVFFGDNMSMESACQYTSPFEYVKSKVKLTREKIQSEARSTKNWWLFQRSRPAMRNALSKKERFIVTPMVSKYRLFAWVEKNVIPENLLVVITREDDYFIGILHSKPHELWSRNKGTQLREAESGQRYTPSTTFETYPFPWSPGKEPVDNPLVQNISQAAKELVEKRDYWLNPPEAHQEELERRTLTNLYNQNPTWLQLAHEKLDKAVFAAYGWPDNLSDDEILERLLELNIERSRKI
jgi:hypothetical protein